MEEKEKAVQVSKVPLIDKIAYGFGGLFKTGLGAYIATYYWMYFLTDIAGVPTLLAATAKTAITAIKLIEMSLTGVLIDSTNFKSGRYRTWILIGDIALFITSGLLFLRYTYSKPLTYVIVLLVIYAVNIFGYNVSWTSTRALVGLMATNTEDSVGLAAAATVGSHAAGIVYGVILAFALGTFEGSYNQYMYAAYLMGLIYIIGTIVMRRLATKYELKGDVQYKAAKKDNVPLKDMLVVLQGSGKWLFISSAIMNIASGIQGVLLVYYTRYVLNNPRMLEIGVTASSISAVIAAMISPKLCARFSKKGVFIFAMFSGALTYLAYYFIGSNGYLYILVRVIYQLCATPVATAMVSMANDVADQKEMEGYKSAKAFSQSMIGVTIRVGSLISTAAASFGLAAIGYTAGVELTQTILKAIVLMMSVVPAVSYAISGLLIMLYRVDEKKIDEYRQAKLAAQNREAE